MGIHYWDNINRTRPWLEGFAAVGSWSSPTTGVGVALRRNCFELAEEMGAARVGFEISGPLGSCDAADPGEAGTPTSRSHHRQICQDG
jgi:hypothetical protein